MNNYADWSEFDNVIVWEPQPHMIVCAAMPNLRRIVTFCYESNKKLGLRLIVQCYDDNTYDFQLVEGTTTIEDNSAADLFYDTLKIVQEDGYDGI